MGDLELNWKGKRTEIDKIVLPFQEIETVSISRTGKNTLLSSLRTDNGSWKNKLIWGDNKYILSSLLKDSSIAGKIKLIYIDPPFFTGTNMSINIKVGDREFTKEPSMIEEIAYRNMWKEGPSSFLQYIYDRLKLMRDLLAEDGSIFVRIDYHYGHHIKIILDEIFGYENFRNEIIVRRGQAKAGFFKQFDEIKSMAVAYDTIFWYSKSDATRFPKITKEASTEHQESGRWSNLIKARAYDRPTMKYEILGVKKDAPWMWSKERAFKAADNYQKYLEIFKKSNETLEQYWIKTGGQLEFVRNNNGQIQYWIPPRETDLVDNNWLDIKGYSHITDYPTENSEELLERVLQITNPGDLVADFFSGSGTTVVVAEKLNRRWIGCDIGRFSIHTIRKRLLEIPTCKPFEVLNMGKYERKHWASQTLGENYKNYVNFIVQLYNAKQLDNFEFIHGKKGSKAVHVGLVDSPVTKKEIFDALTECKKVGFDSLDVLGWEWEMGLNDSIIKEAKNLYKVNLALWIIPREVMDKRAVEAGDIDFYELAHLQVDLVREGSVVKVKLKDFIIPNPELIPPEIQKKIKKWSDYIDYWAVDWDFKEVFHNQWQIYRTKDAPNLKLETSSHTYKQKGKHLVLIKVIDIFGNDTSTIREVVIK